MDRQKHRRDVSAREVFHGAGGARIGNVGQVDLRRQLQQLHGEMLRRSPAGGSIVDFARLAAGKRDQLRESADVERRMHNKRKNARRDLHDRHEALLRIVGDRAIKARIHHKGIDGHQQRLAVGSGARRRLRADVAARTRLVLDDDRLIPALPQFLAEDAREQIGPCACRKRDVEPNGLLRLRLGRPCRIGARATASIPSMVRRECVELAESIVTTSFGLGRRPARPFDGRVAMRRAAINRVAQASDSRRKSATNGAHLAACCAE